MVPHKSHRSYMSHIPLSQDHFSDLESAAWLKRLGVARVMAVARQALATTGSAAGLADWLSPPELMRLQELTFAKRRQEWLGGRLAAKHAACRVLALAGAGPGPAWSNLAVTNRPSGRPALNLFPAGPPRLLPDISISHSHGWAVAMAVMGATCGIDLQLVSTKTVAVRDRFCMVREQDKICRLTGAPAPPELGLTLLWAAKEAVRKAAVQERLPGFLEMELVEARCPAAGQWVLVFAVGAARAMCAVAATFWGDFALAFTVVDEQGTKWHRGRVTKHIEQYFL